MFSSLWFPDDHLLRYSRRETIRRQRIESEQRRRDELRDGYARLKETLPPSNQKSSKVSLLERGKFSVSVLRIRELIQTPLATGHIRYLETVKEQLELRLKSAEAEVHRLRNVNEASCWALPHSAPRVPSDCIL